MDMKKYLFIAASALALASCSSEDFVGTEGGNVENGANKAIDFGGGTGKITRANLKGQDAATALGNHFVVFGDKTTGSTTQKVYDHYDVQWKGKEAASLTQSNKNGWEYVGYTPNKNTSLVAGSTQSIKYWDFSATEYNFAAFSLGKLTSDTENNPYENQVKYDETGTVSTGKVRISQISSNATKYTVEGSVSNIAELYISDRITAKPSGATTPNINYKDDVQFNFRALKTLVRMGIFETVPGYSVKDVKFYSSANTTSDQRTKDPILYAEKNTIPAGYGTATITFGTNATNGNYNKAMVDWNSSSNENKITLKALPLKGADSKEKDENVYIGRASNEASLPTEYETVIPSKEIGALTLKVDYTLVSTDGSGETINVTGATATVPSEYTQWQPNYSYTYIFKISDKTNGSTGGDSKGLYPIVFDAVVTETEEGIQNTITTVQDVSITTYANGNKIGNEYKKTDNIYACVIDKETRKTADLYKKIENEESEVNPSYTYYAKLYKLSVPEGTTASLTEAEAKAILEAEGMTLGGKKLAVVKETSSAGTLDPRFVNKIDKDDTANGVEIDGKFFKFKVAAGIYVFAYDNGTAKSYKVIKVVE